MVDVPKTFVTPEGDDNEIAETFDVARGLIVRTFSRRIIDRHGFLSGE